MIKIGNWKGSYMFPSPPPSPPPDLNSRDSSSLGLANPAQVLLVPPVLSSSPSSVLMPIASRPMCTPLLDIYGLCNCPLDPEAHVPVLVPMQGRAFPACRDKSFRSLYIDDSIIASVVHVDRDCAPLLPTLGPHVRWIAVD